MIIIHDDKDDDDDDFGWPSASPVTTTHFNSIATPKKLRRGHQENIAEYYSTGKWDGAEEKMIINSDNKIKMEKRITSIGI